MKVSGILLSAKRKYDAKLMFRLVLFAALLALCIGAIPSVGTSGAQYRLGYEPVMSKLQAILATGDLSVPDWEEAINRDGTLRDPVDATGVPLRNGVPARLRSSGGIEAIFIPDNISAGVGVDMSALKAGETLTDSLVYNGMVNPGHDLGNAHFYVVKNAQGHVVLYGAVERLGAPGVDSYVEFEFNQGQVQVWSGVPWQIHGERTSGDILVRMNYAAGRLSSVEVKSWDATDVGGSFKLLTNDLVSAESSCGGMAGVYAFCNAARLQLDPRAFPPPSRDEVYDAAGHSVEVPAPDCLVHIAVDVVGLLGYDVQFSSIQVKTPGDIILGGFRNMGYWPAHSDTRGRNNQ